MTDLAVAFTDHVLGLSLSKVPQGAIEAAKTFLLDTIGVGVAGARAPLAEEVLRVSSGWGVAGIGLGANVLGRGRRLPTPSAAFVNAFQIHCQEYDCVHEPAVVHPMAVIGGALLSEVDARPASGAAFLAALIGAVDVAAGLGVAVKSPIQFFRPANAGLFGATLGIASLRGFDRQTALDALGYALAQCSGTMQAHVEGKPALPLQVANAARAAIAACDLAEAGIPGPNDVFEGPYGYLPLFEEDWDVAPVLDSLGTLWRIEEVSHKPFPTGRAAQGGIVLVQKLRTQGLAADALQSLTLSGPPIIKRLVGRPLTLDMMANYARLCFQYSGAVALRKGTVGLGDFRPDALTDPETTALGAKISVIEDGSTDPAAFAPQTAIAKTKDGGEMTATIQALYGSPADPMTDAAHLEKFVDCLAYGFDKPMTDLGAALTEAVSGLETLTDAGRLTRLASGVLSP